MEFFNCCVIDQVTTLKRKRATDLRLQKCQRELFASFQSQHFLYQFKFLYSFPEVFPNRQQLRCTLYEVRNWPKYERHIPITQSNEIKKKKQYSDKKRNTDLDKYFSYYKVRFPGALLAQNSHCHQKQGLDWYSSSLVTSRRPHMIWSIVSTGTKDHNFHWLVSL